MENDGKNGSGIRCLWDLSYEAPTFCDWTVIQWVPGKWEEGGILTENYGRVWDSTGSYKNDD